MWGLVLTTTPTFTGVIFFMRLANERLPYIVTYCLIGWVHTQNDPCFHRMNAISRTVPLYFFLNHYDKLVNAYFKLLSVA